MVRRSGIWMSCLLFNCAPPKSGKLVSVTPSAPGATSAPAMTAPAAGLPVSEGSLSFAEALAFLKQHGEVVTLNAPSGGRVAVSPKYQGRVMTSAVSDQGASLGYLNRDFIASGRTGTAFDNYGGEDRFWLGPEGGQFALYFPPGQPFEFEHWQTPAAFQEGSWPVVAHSEREVSFARVMQLQNYAGAEFKLEVRRSIRTLGTEAVARLFEDSTARLLQALSWVAFESVNQITNTGKNAWGREAGSPSIWILGMYNPAPDTWVIAPFDRAGSGPVVNDQYFGKVPPERLRVLDEGVLLFKCDGQLRSKIGLGPARALPFVGSYSADAQLLTLVHYDRPEGATDYVNSMWEQQREPFGGDVVNSYNDGPVAPGQPALGGFYELETSSPAAFLAPGESLTHTQRTLHFVGSREQLEPLARAVLGVSLAEVPTSP